MSIVGLLESHGAILAVNDRGELLVWDLKTLTISQGRIVFENNISLLPSKGRIRIDECSLQGIVSFNSKVFMFSKDTIYVGEICFILNNASDQKLKALTEIKALAFLQKKQWINCLEVVTENILLIGTNKGNVYLFNLQQNKINNKIDLGGNMENEVEEIFVFATIQKQFLSITSVVLYSNNSLAIIGTSTGKLFVANAETLQIIYQMTATCKEVFSAVHRLVYVLHQNYITVWSIKLNTCLEYLDYSHSQSLLPLNEQLLIVGPSSNLLWVDEDAKLIELSMRSAKVVKQIDSSMVAVGGSEGLVDVIMGGTRLMTLFTN